MAMLTSGLVILGVVALGVGLGEVTRVTFGVFMGTVACFLAILARMSQAAEHADVARRLHEKPAEPTPTAAGQVDGGAA